jgi:hypothetical protein
MFALEDSELLTESKILQQQTLVRTKDAKQCSEPEPEDVEHDGTVMAGRILVCAPMSLISKPRIIVARDSIPPRVSYAHGVNKTGIGAMSQNGYLRNGASP